MGLSAGGSLLWIIALSGSLAWPGLLALVFTRLRRKHILTPDRFLQFAIPLSYAVMFLTHAFLADFVMTGADRAVETGLLSAVWWRIIFVLGLESALAVGSLCCLARYFRQHPPAP